MLLTIRAESGGNKKNHLDEFIGEIDSDQDNVYILKPLALKLRTSLLNCNVCFLVRFLCVQVHITLLQKGRFCQ